jgi:ABC-type antimicrobial peptide transport system permease subunit
LCSRARAYYGIMACNVARRTNEIGVRMALGAQRRDVLWIALRQALLLIAIGMAIGVPVALAAVRVIASELYGVLRQNTALCLRWKNGREGPR